MSCGAPRLFFVTSPSILALETQDGLLGRIIASIAQCPTEKNGEVTFRWGNPNNLYKSKSILGSATDAHSIYNIRNKVKLYNFYCNLREFLSSMQRKIF
jgi:hypothetical protein